MTQQVTYISTSEVARRFGVERSAVSRWITSGKIKPAVTTPGGHHKFTPALRPLPGRGAAQLAGHRRAPPVHRPGLLQLRGDRRVHYSLPRGPSEDAQGIPG
ncbi:helix-turn-helix domain-containing protein [Pseudarthrobacter oxydans]|uniref:helix-turn-helix domain-containing protein n=1 Tax=Pseudarthrobacter oxydans TaxID=1671 RepID=UPI0038148C40